MTSQRCHDPTAPITHPFTQTRKGSAMLFPVCHPFSSISPEWTRLHNDEPSMLRVDRRQPSIWKLTR